jgi:hypothetical protein
MKDKIQILEKKWRGHFGRGPANQYGTLVTNYD